MLADSKDFVLPGWFRECMPSGLPLKRIRKKAFKRINILEADSELD